MIYEYLFRHCHSGYYSTYQPFTTDKKLTQADADRFMLLSRPAANRLGAGFEELAVAATDHGYTIKSYHCIYIKHDESPDFKNSYDPLPDDFKNWHVINNIVGNY